jgi:hypothetical protein
MKTLLFTRALMVAAFVVGSFATSGCAGTKAAYDAADTLEERAFVATEHYSAVITQAADLKDRGALKGEALTKVREIESVARPVILKLGPLVQNFKAAHDAESEVALQRALDDAVLAIADLVRALKGDST